MVETTGDAAADTDWANSRDFYVVLTDQPGKDAWPITRVTFILMRKIQHDPQTAKRTLDFFAWTHRSGGELANEPGYVLMPDSVMELIHKEWETQLKEPDGKPI
ncbi:MAG: hypothetical protein P4L55_09355 [Syntrophobacteraceae bacterium]|nr:hypothetical protein [Syntrophobacteraceae bacterium]